MFGISNGTIRALWIVFVHFTVVKSESIVPESSDCKSFLKDRLSSCETYQVATLNSSPARCLHIEDSSLNDESHHESYCVDFDKWFDGTNDCRAYGYQHNKDWCGLYGNHIYASSPYTAKQACCVCGGGSKKAVEFPVGSLVQMDSLPQDCKGLKVAKILESPNHVYTLEVLQNCGRKFVSNTRFGLQHKHQYTAGQLLKIQNNQIAKMKHYKRLELRKCRAGLKQQEFSLIPKDVDNHGGSGNFTIYHPLTNTNVSMSLDKLNPDKNEVELIAAFEDDTFDRALDFFHVIFHHHQSSSSILLHGKFGETEFPEALWTPILKRHYHETPYSMWSFQKIDHDSDTDSDEHIVWLEKMTESLGIEYLRQLAPWHLLDVDRAASKNDVKLRFRELSRIYHPDKVLPEKKEQSSKIFVLLQNAYEGLKSANEAQKEAFRTSADTDSQLFSHSQHVIELLPFHWTKHGNGTESRYIIKANSTNVTKTKTEKGSVQIWLLFLYSARCGMSRTVEGFLDLAAGHLKNEEIKVGAYGCGLYDGFKPTKTDSTGVISDEICKQFNRRETPNVHVVVETISGDSDFIEDNAQFKYFKSDVPTGNTTHLRPQTLIDFALNGKRLWRDMHLVRKMTKDDFADEAFVGNVSVVAFFDATNSNTGDEEVRDAITSSLPTLARRFLKAELHVGIAFCGSSYEENATSLDCSEFGVGWLPDVKLYGRNRTDGISLLRGNFGDRRDVQIGK